MRISFYSPDDFIKLEKPWKILEKGADMTSFQTYDWYNIINKQFLLETKKNLFRIGIYVLISDNNDNPLLIAPLQFFKVGAYIKGIGLRKGFYFIGRQGFSDYLNFIYQDITKECLDLLFQTLKEKYNSDFFCLENISERTDSHKIISEFYNPEQIDSHCMTLPLADNFETYFKSLSKSTRQNIRTAFNRAAKDNVELSYEIFTQISPELSKQLMEIRAQRLQKKKDETNAALSTKAQLYNKVRNTLVEFSSVNFDLMKEVKNCWCFIARCNGEIAAFFYALYKPENKTVYLLLAGIDKKYEWYSPGITQLVSFIENEIKNNKINIENFDMTRGTEKYKYDLKATEITTSQFNLNV